MKSPKEPFRPSETLLVKHLASQCEATLVLEHFCLRQRVQLKQESDHIKIKVPNGDLYFYMVGIPGFEPGTSSSQAKRSTKLSHIPTFDLKKICSAGQKPRNLGHCVVNYIKKLTNIIGKKYKRKNYKLYVRLGFYFLVFFNFFFIFISKIKTTVIIIVTKLCILIYMFMIMITSQTKNST